MFQCNCFIPKRHIIGGHIKTHSHEMKVLDRGLTSIRAYSFSFLSTGVRSTVLPSFLTPHSSLLTNSCYLSTYLTDNTPSVPIIISHVSVSHLHIDRLLHNSHKWTFKMSNNTNPILDTRISVHPDFSGLHPSVKLVLPPLKLKRGGLKSSGQN